MRVLGAVLAFGVLSITAASAQEVASGSYMSGTYQCIANCKGPGLAYITQTDRNLQIVNEAGEPTRAWIDYPGHLWAEAWNSGAIYTPDTGQIQFGNGAVWQRYVPPPPPPPPVVRVRVRHHYHHAPISGS
jgi:hypothetical protein